MKGFIKKALAVFVLMVALPSIAQNYYPPTVEYIQPSSGLRICFYIDGCNRMHENGAYVKAINALESILRRNDNSLMLGLNERGCTGVKIDSKIGYLLTPFSIRPIDLSKKAEKLDYKYEDNASLDEWFTKILSNEKNQTANTVICIISNNKIFQRKHGLAKRTGTTSFYFLYASHDDSVKDSWFSSDWNEDEWKTFIDEALGTKGNDIANAIANDYFELSNEEKNNSQKLQVSPSSYSLNLKGFLAIRPRSMWSTTIQVNGSTVNLPSEDSASYQPIVGENKIIITMKSPTGSGCSNVWTGSNFIYDRLSEKELGRLRSVFEKAEGINNNKQIKFSADKNFEALKAAKEKWSFVMRKDIKTDLLSKVELLAASNKKNQNLIEDYSKFNSRFDSLIARTRLVDDEEVLKELEKIKSDATKSANELNNNFSQDDLYVGNSKLDALEKRLDEIEKEKFEARKNGLISAIKEKISSNSQAKNLQELEDILSQVQALDIKTEGHSAKLNELLDKFNSWEPIIEVLEEVEQKEETEPSTDDTLSLERQEILAKIAGLKEKYPASDYENTTELDEFESAAIQADSEEQLKSIKEKVDEWKAVPKGSSISPLIIVVLIVLAAVVFFIFRPKAVATLTYKNSQDEELQPIDLKVNKRTSLSSLGLDLQAKIIKEEDDYKLELSAMNASNLWCKDMRGNTPPRRITDVAEKISEGQYQILESENAMRAKGILEWSTKQE